MESSILDPQTGGGSAAPHPRTEADRAIGDGGDGGDGDLVALVSPSDRTTDPTAEEVRMADVLVRLAKKAGMDLFHDDEWRAYARVSQEGHLATHAIHSEAFGRKLRWLYYQETGRSP